MEGDCTESKQPVVYLTRIETFSACHRLHSDHLSAKENESLYDKCNNPNGHGHNYRVEVTVKGKVDPKTGMVMNISDLKRHIKMVVMDVLDHKNLDKDIPAFKHYVSTTENLAVFIWKQLKRVIDRSLLYRVRIHETDKNVITYKGEFE